MSSHDSFNWTLFAARLEGMDRKGKSCILIRLAFELTVLARDTYEPGTREVSDPSRLRAINEIMHRLTRRILNLVREDPDDWKEVEFWQMLSELSTTGDCLDDLIAAASTASSSRASAHNP
jgi:hypothetical protein